MLHISPRIPGQYFAELPFEEEILEFLRFLGHSTSIKTLTDPSIPRRNRVNWHYVRDDVLFSTIKVVSRHQTTQQYGVILPIELTNDDIRNNKAYKEYYACATGEATPKPKASARKKTGGSASSTTPLTSIATPTPTTTVVAAPRLSAAAKGKQPARATTPTKPTDVERTEAKQLKIVLKRSRQETHISQQHGSGTDEGTGSRPGVSDVPSDDSEEELSWNSSDDEDVDEQTKGREESEGDKTDESDDEDEISKIGEQEVTKSDEGDNEAIVIERESEDEETREQEEESFDPIPQTPEDNEDDDNNVEDRGLRIGLESLFTTGSTTVTPIPSPQSTMTPSIISTFTSASQLPTPPTQIPSLDLQSLLTFASVFHFEDRVKSLKDNFSNISGIVNQYMHQQMPEVKIIKERVKTQVKAQVTRILPIIEEAVNAQLEAEVLTRSSHSSRTSYAVAADLSEMELKKILIDKMEGNKFIQESTILKRRREDDDQEGPSAGSDRGSKRQREGGEHASASTPSEPGTGSAGRTTTRSQSRQLSASESAFAEEPVQPTCQMEEPSHSMFEIGADDQPIIQTTQHPEWFSRPRRPPTPDRDWNKYVPAAQGKAQSWISALEKQTNARSSFNELLDTPIDFSNFIMNRLGVDTLTPKLLAGPTYELMRGSCHSLTELEYHLEEVYKATMDQLDWVNPEGK
uniref:Uncharacterized protein n=1 Tax=Tanacetum cinerariifolium TaxID=118510 RepID=A0A699K6L9_TANCI|nr:hypothetical protein [Tanacetum cinerariifolium]